jgi:hypothetical protein
VGGGAGGSGQSNRLASMFEPPRDLLFNGNFEEAKAYAASLGKWLVSSLLINKIKNIFPLSLSSILPKEREKWKKGILTNYNYCYSATTTTDRESSKYHPIRLPSAQ